MPDFHLDNPPTVRDIQKKILDIAKYIDALCRRNGIEYCIAAGTALGAVRHGGFIPWDDDLDIFMTPDQYRRFKEAFVADNPKGFILQEWFVADNVLERAKVRMNGTTFIEEVTKNRKDIHQGIFIDIFLLHKVPKNVLIQKWVYTLAKFSTLYALSHRNWKPKTKLSAFASRVLRFLPCQTLSRIAYHFIGKYDNLPQNFMYFHWVTRFSFNRGLFAADHCFPVTDIPFEDTTLLAPRNVRKMLEALYGDYMQLPSEAKRKAAVHAMFADIDRDYTFYIEGAARPDGCLQAVPISGARGRS